MKRFFLFSFLAIFGLTSLSTNAATINVTETSDSLTADGLCSLREALISVNTDTPNNDCTVEGTYSSEDVIVLLNDTTYTLDISGADDATASGDLDILDGVTIQTEDPEGTQATITMDASLSNERIFHIITSSDVSLKNLTLTGTQFNNVGAPTELGSVIYSSTVSDTNATGNLEIYNSIISNNTIDFSAGNGSLVLGGFIHFAGTTTRGSRMLTIDNTTIRDNTMTATNSSASNNIIGTTLYTNFSDLTLTNSSVTNNSLEVPDFLVGNIYIRNAVNTQIENSSFSLNTCESANFGTSNGGGGCGATFLESDSLTIENSDFSFNTILTDGNSTAAVTVTNIPSVVISNSTIANNSGTSANGDLIGGGIAFVDTTAYLNFVTIANNSLLGLNGDSKGAGLNAGADAIIYLKSTLIADNAHAQNANDLGNDCYEDPTSGNISSLDYNFIEDSTDCGIDTQQTNDIFNESIELDNVADYGGDTSTVAITDAMSPYNASDCLDHTGTVVTTDQRGAPRDGDTSCDIGAFELVNYYTDEDGDGAAGKFTNVITDYTEATDCDDNDATRYPGNAETCNGIDNDCDGTPDNNPTVDTTTYYADEDGDGIGVADNTIEACSLPDSGYIESVDNIDCDDTDPNNYPGNTEVCDGNDNDCDGVADDEVECSSNNNDDDDDDDNDFTAPDDNTPVDNDNDTNPDDDDDDEDAYDVDSSETANTSGGCQLSPHSFAPQNLIAMTLLSVMSFFGLVVLRQRKR